MRVKRAGIATKLLVLVLLAVLAAGLLSTQAKLTEARSARDELARQVEEQREANAALKSWRLEECTLYVTLEPCPMCAGAIINARIPRVYYGARDSAMGACGGVLNLFMEDFPNTPALTGGILEEECRKVLADFFAALRGPR